MVNPAVKATQQGAIIQTLSPWVPLLQFEKYRKIILKEDPLVYYHFPIIYLPANTPVAVQAGELTIEKCSLSSLSATSAEVNECKILKGFEGKAETISVRGSIISKDSNFNSKNISYENNTYIND